ncbi:hypothetical protein J5Y04_26250 [Kitasatospora sp. RG8]|uniref:hypothetical protein n=1 Tax=Kitasatospora sp. RG8 TaxID=2820815 RepID=UPI001ADFD116|nr:hypothetical protein [Kitasatospora sp. RG8]MBP0453020.1 hypothetical protein [Kitasatospora sp. RG8]
MIDEGIAWIGGGLDHFYLTFVHGVGIEELAVRLGAEQGSLMDAVTLDRTLRLSGESLSQGVLLGERLPGLARFGDAGNGWVFAVESCEAPFRPDRGSGTGRPHPSAGTRSLHILDTGMDPPWLDHLVDGRHVWGYAEGVPTVPASPFTRELLTRGGLLPAGDDTDPDELAGLLELDEVYRLVGGLLGVGLPAEAALNHGLPGAFTEPRTFTRPVERLPDPPHPPCGECGAPMAVRSERWGPGTFRLECTRSADGCPGARVEPLLRTGTRTEPNPRYDNVRRPV